VIGAATKDGRESVPYMSSNETSYGLVRGVARLLKALHAIFMFPLLLLYWISSQRVLIDGDANRWFSNVGGKGGFLWRFLQLLRNRAFRTLFYHRLKCGCMAENAACRLFALIYRPLSTLVIFTRCIGPGLFIQHGIATIIAARRIGKGCWINQQVTIGYTNSEDCPTLGDRVVVGCGAKVLGNITVGDDVKIGANAVVLKDVPPRCTVVGVPARIVRQDGVRVAGGNT
jgi:serine O-acetyltransferase